MTKKFAAFLAVGLAPAFLAVAPKAFATDLSLDGNLRLQCGTGTESGGAVTLANKCGVITTSSLSTAPGSTFQLTITNTVASSVDLVLASVEQLSNGTGAPILQEAVASNSLIVIRVKNGCSTSSGIGNCTGSFNGTLKIKYLLVKP